MKRISLVVLLPLILTACGTNKQSAEELTEEQRAIKEKCVAADYEACAEIGHMARKEMNAQVAGEEMNAQVVE